MMPEVLQQSLLPEQRSAGLTLEEDVHVVTLKHGDKVVARFSAQGAQIKDIQYEARMYLENRKAVDIETLPQCLTCRHLKFDDGTWRPADYKYFLRKVQTIDCAIADDNGLADALEALVGKCMAWSEKK